MKKWIKKSGFNLYHGLAFVAGLAMMMFELVAARILAPTIGSSTYVWTSVIGVIIAALSLGYWAGGRMADARNRKFDLALLNLLAAAAVLLTLMIGDAVLHGIGASRYDLRLQGMAASIVLFAPASFVIGMLSPYLAKLNISSLKTSAQAVAGLSSCNAVGSIVGTLLTGFVLFGLIGSRWIMVAVVAIFIVAHWTVEPWKRAVTRSILTAAMAVAAILSLADRQRVVDIDTATAHYQVMDILYDGREARALLTSPGVTQSAVYKDDSGDLAFWYTRQMARVVAAANRPGSILVIGGGAMTLPAYLARKYPETRVDVVDIDPGLVEIARKYFAYDDPANVNFIANDGRAYVQQTGQKYDIVLVDAYNGSDIPWSLTTEEYAGAIKRITTGDGVVAVNVIANTAGECAPLLGAIDAAYQGQLGKGVYRKRSPMDDREATSMVIVYGWKKKPLAEYAELNMGETRAFTDDFAPIEPLQLKCVG
ncbi:MAG: fused MFS/spermidine synthase [Candidatus Accumulibacter sp.]|jgi:predicted membrane-bound spermidine synthase|nr:fused MFS/spermidine synthase [Accumulibacter sp.]